MKGRLLLAAAAAVALAGCEPESDKVVSLADTTTTSLATTTTVAPATTTTVAQTTTTTAAAATTTTTTARPRPTTTTVAAASPRCHPSYRGACLPPDASDVDCAGGSGNGPEYTSARNFSVVGPDEYDLDRDGDGVACED